MDEYESIFICPEHGNIEPSQIGYTCPLSGRCPECGKWILDSSPEGGIKVLSGKEAVLKRPELYKKHHPEIYEKYKSEIEAQEKENSED